MTAHNTPYEERFWRKVSKDHLHPLECWEWIGAKTGSKGYGVLQIKVGAFKRTRRATHISWELAYGPFDTTLFVLHRCDNPACVRPEHLFLGTAKDNMADCIKKGRHSILKMDHKGEANGFSKLTADDVAEIRLLRSNGVPQKDVGAKFGIHPRHVSKIFNRRQWE